MHVGPGFPNYALAGRVNRRKGKGCMPDRQSKQKFEIIPGVGAPPVHFGMTGAEVRRVLGDPDGSDLGSSGVVLQ